MVIPTAEGSSPSSRAFVACEEIDEPNKAEFTLRNRENLLRLFLENNPIPRFLKDREGKYFFINQQFTVSYRLTEEQIIGKTDAELFSTEEAVAIRANDRKVIETRVPMAFDETTQQEDGRHVHFVQKFPLLNAEGEVYGIGGIATDMTKQRREESARLYGEERYRLVLETASDAVISMDHSGAIQAANPAVKRIFDFEPEELTGRPLTILMPEYMRELHTNGFNRYLSTGRRHINWQGTELTARRKNGEEFPVEVSFGELNSAGHKLFTGFIRDISERKRAEEMLATQTRQAAVRADVSVAFAREESIETILHECTESMVRHLDATFARIWTLRHDGMTLELRASAGLYTHLDGVHARIQMGSLKIGMIAEEQKPFLTNDVIDDPRISDRAWAAREGISSFAGQPLMIGNRTLGVMAMFSRKPLTAGTAETLASVADLIAQGIERKGAEERLRASERTLRELTETIPQMLWSAEANGAIDYCNRRVQDYTGLGAEQVRGDGWLKSVHPDDFEKMNQAWTAAVSTGEPFQYEFRCLRATDHAYRWCISSALPLRDKEGRAVKWFGSVVDLHDWKEAQTALQTTQAELAQISRLTIMGELAASIAHEVNQPLTAVTNNGNACLRLLANHNLDADVLRRALEEIVADGTRASSVITRIRSFLKKKPAERNVLDMNEVIHETVALAGREVSENRVRIEYRLTTPLPPVVADRVLMQQVLLNLIVNAIESMVGIDDQPGLLSLESRIDESGNVLVAVRDSGIGLGSDPGGVFTPFYTTKANGMGMGLSISRSLVEGLGGRLWAGPNSPRGSVFSFTLPIATESGS
jgi:PAS domain S-box-containing protein